MLAIRRTIAVKGDQPPADSGAWLIAGGGEKRGVGRRKIGLASLLPIRRFSEQCTAVQNKG
jgi:hypothetical protein